MFTVATRKSVTHALDAKRHVDEIDRVHGVARRRLGEAGLLAKRQQAYREEVLGQLSRTSAPVASPSRRKTRARRARELA